MKVRYYGIWSPDVPSSTRSGPRVPDRPAAGAHRAAAPHANAVAGRTSADALSSVSNGDLDPGGRPHAATDACAMTSVFARRRSPVRAPRVPVAPSASPTDRPCVRRVPIERGVYPRAACPFSPARPDHRTGRAGPLTTRPRSLKLQ